MVGNAKWVSFNSEVAAVSVLQPHHVISITEGEHRAKFAVEHKSLLRLSFHDTEVLFSSEYVVFSLVDARKILAFVDAIPDGEGLIVHCQAGISRSAAVAKFLIQHRGYQLRKDKYCNGNMSMYNGRVYGVLRTVDHGNTRLLAAASQEEIDRYGKQPKW